MGSSVWGGGVGFESVGLYLRMKPPLVEHALKAWGEWIVEDIVQTNSFQIKKLIPGMFSSNDGQCLDC